ncbi:HIT family protein [Bacillus sp. FJAT-49732]|uniref:HIT family protein n=1 Tax=Lederbergia citrisecunda TaxID=2833583 RepID=A0A942TQ23_9BACI|nr:HIT family protein [Lederbergia citrisecunda]MBS4200802.1 HIT family protein [Lederbergia citrisecunda]
MPCIFCEIENVIFENELAKCFYDKFPVNQGHILIVPKRHCNDYFSLKSEEKHSIDELIMRSKMLIDSIYRPEGYNIGVNCGEVAGQTIFHCHIHIIPRYRNDMDEPTGGVRGVIPHKRIYTQEVI